MYTFSFQSSFETREELREEIRSLLWKIDHTWPVGFSTKNLSWAKSRTDESWLKVSGGSREQHIEVVRK
jgi:hypothetical protein